MKYAILAARILLGLMFFVFGLNNILHFIPMPPMPPGDALTFSTVLEHNGFMTFVGLLMLIAGLLLLVGRFVPIALVLLGPILVNILLYHFLLLGGKGAGLGLFATALALFLVVAYRRSFASLFDPAPEKRWSAAGAAELGRTV